MSSLKENGLPTQSTTSPLCFLVATWFGTGLSSIAPGTVGTLATLPVHFALILLPTPVHFAMIALLALGGMVCAGRLAKARGEKDPQIIVVDESAGVLFALFFVRDAGWLAVIAAVVLFRVLDIFKPWPIRALENLRPAGLGIMADDLAAGLVAGLAVLVGAGLFT
jgi:phosphatidylglycerophosphatase A